jgi:hypothetical protein
MSGSISSFDPLHLRPVPHDHKLVDRELDNFPISFRQGITTYTCAKSTKPPWGSGPLKQAVIKLPQCGSPQRRTVPGRTASSLFQPYQVAHFVQFYLTTDRSFLN